MAGAGKPVLKSSFRIRTESLTFLHKFTSKVEPPAVYDVAIIRAHLVRFALLERINPKLMEKLHENFGIGGLALCGKIQAGVTAASFRTTVRNRQIDVPGSVRIVADDLVSAPNLFHRCFHYVT